MRAHCQTRHVLEQDTLPDSTLPIIKTYKTLKFDVHANLRVTKVAASFIFPLMVEDEVLKEETGSPRGFFPLRVHLISNRSKQIQKLTNIYSS